MNKNKFVIYMVVIFILAFTGCANTVKYKFESSSFHTATDGPRTTIAALSLNWTDYNIYYSGTYPQRINGILFDPKNDATNLVPKGIDWSKVEDRATYDQVIKWAAGSSEYDGRLFRIIDPGGQFVGYLYLCNNFPYAGARVVDENTIIFLPIRKMMGPIFSG